jgi:hypothetical protein
MSGPVVSPAAFYCVADSRYFLGAVALVNSLRLSGHDEAVHVLDCGLTESQRKILEPEVELVRAQGDEPPWLRKAELPLALPAAVRILIDADMIVTRPLDELIELAAGDRIVAFRDRQQRFFAEWGSATGLGDARPGPYVSSGLVLCGGDAGGRLLELLHEHRAAVDFERTFWRRGPRDYPFLYADQDVLNAILTTRERDSLLALDERLAATPPYRGLRVRDSRALSCGYRDGERPYVVHQYVRKPWLEPTYHGVYSRLWRRLVVGPDLAIRPPEDELPPRMRTGPLAAAKRAGTSASDFLRWHFGDRLPRPIATRLEDRRRQAGHR